MHRPGTGDCETLFNGIRLPEEWPPRYAEPGSRRPMEFAHLASVPAVIPIDTGRQLFVDDFLIEATDLDRRFHQAEKYEDNPVLKPQTELELNDGVRPVASLFNDGVWYDGEDKLFKMWYHAGWFDGTALAISEDGLGWTRPDLDVVRGTNRILVPRSGYKRDGACVWLDHESEDRGQRFKMFVYHRYEGGKCGEVYTSADGIHWSAPQITSPLGDNSGFFYNPFRKKWVFSIREVLGTELRRGERCRYYREHSDFLEGAKWEKDEPVFWASADELDLPDPSVGDPTQLYNVDAVGYESIMLGLFAIHKGPSNEICDAGKFPKRTDLMLGFSRDGFHWDRPDRGSFIPPTGREGDWDRAYIHSAGGTCLVVDDKLYFYYGAWSGISPKRGGDTYAGGSAGVAFLRRDGFASIRAGSEGGYLITRPVRFTGKYMFVNVDVPGGELRAEILTEDGRTIEPFSLKRCMPISVDKTRQGVTWEGSDDVLSLVGKAVKIRFHITNGGLYSFWVSGDKSGASNGFVGAGGPGYATGVDLGGSV